MGLLICSFKNLFEGGGGAGGIFSFFSKLFGGAAEGGLITGPGSPTSDSIPTMLSDGEFVINAASTKKHRALLEMINSGQSSRLGQLGQPQQLEPSLFALAFNQRGGNLR